MSEDVSIFLGHDRGHDIACTIQITNELRLGDAAEGRRDDPINGVLVESLPIADSRPCQWVIGSAVPTLCHPYAADMCGPQINFWRPERKAAKHTRKPAASAIAADHTFVSRFICFSGCPKGPRMLR